MTIYSQLTPNFLLFELRFYIKKELLSGIFSKNTLKNPQKYGASNRDRTCTGIPMDPKSIASANSAILAFFRIFKCGFFYYSCPA